MDILPTQSLVSAPFPIMDQKYLYVWQVRQQTSFRSGLAASLCGAKIIMVNDQGTWDRIPQCGDKSMTRAFQVVVAYISHM